MMNRIHNGLSILIFQYFLKKRNVKSKSLKMSANIDKFLTVKEILDWESHKMFIYKMGLFQ
jgi:hypothetical protein